MHYKNINLPRSIIGFNLKIDERFYEPLIKKRSTKNYLEKVKKAMVWSPLL
jgi:hypothetical protein